MSAGALTKILAYDAKPMLDDYEDLTDLIEKANIDDESNEENLKKAFSIAQTTLKSVSRMNREKTRELEEMEKEIQRTVIKSIYIY